MGKASNRKKGINPNEGLVTVSFTFDGITHVNRHQLSAQEMKHMKELCVEYGDLAADQMVWKIAIRGMTMVAENIFAKAALMFIKKHYKGPIVTQAETIPFNETVHLDGLTEVLEGKESANEA